MVERLKALITWNHVFELAAALVFFITGLSWIIDPVTTSAHSPLGGTVSFFRYYWSGLYIASAPLIIVGITCKRIRFRVAGLIALGIGTMMNGIASLGGNLEMRDFNYFVFAAACLVRVYDIYRCKTGRYLGQC